MFDDRPQLGRDREGGRAVRDDDDGQIDGDGSAPFISPFAQSAGDQPWLRSGLPPWHMWGTIATVRIPITGLDLLIGQQQLSKVAYKRPDTWQWLFYARLASAPTPAIPGNQITVVVDFNVIAGLGRGSVNLTPFERFRWNWVAPAGPPTDSGGAIIWSTTAIQPERAPGDTPDHSIFQIVAEDIQATTTVNVVSQEAPLGDVIVEIGAFFAPRSHIRPDWLINGPNELRFPGGEVGAR